MHLLIGRRQIVLSALVLTLGLAVFINWYFTGTDTPLQPEGTAAAEEKDREEVGAIESVNAEETDYFASVRMERSAARDAEVEQLRDVLAQSAEDSESAVQAAALINSLSSAGQREGDIESLVSSTLGGDCVAVISDNSIEIVVDSGNLNEDSVLRISDIVNSVCGNDYENIRISAPAS